MINKPTKKLTEDQKKRIEEMARKKLKAIEDRDLIKKDYGNTYV